MDSMVAYALVWAGTMLGIFFVSFFEDHRWERALICLLLAGSSGAAVFGSTDHSSYDRGYNQGSSMLRQIRMDETAVYNVTTNVTPILNEKSEELVLELKGVVDGKYEQAFYRIPCQKIRGGCAAIPEDPSINFRFVRGKDENDIAVVAFPGKNEPTSGTADPKDKQ